MAGPEERAVLVDSPSLYWRLGEPTGVTDIIDSSGNGRKGVAGAGITMGQASLLGINDGNTAATFSGTSTGRITSTYSPFVVGSIRTFEGWARRTSSTEQDALFGSDTAAGGNQAYLRLEAGAPAAVRFYPRSGNFAEWAAAWPGNNENVHWVLIYNDTAKEAELFINGVSKGKQGTTDAYGVAGNFVVGAWANTFLSPWHGKQDDIAVYESALTEARIKLHYENSIAVPSLVKTGFNRNTKGALITTAAGTDTWQAGFLRNKANFKLVVTESLTGAKWKQGFLRSATGALIVKEAGAEGVVWKSGYLRDKNGALVVIKSEAETPIAWRSGFLRNKSGRLIIE